MGEKYFSKKRIEMGEEAWSQYQKERNVRKVVNWRKRAKKKLIEYKGGKCLSCGYNKDIPAAYDFHHRDPNEKDFQISKNYNKSMKKLKEEVDKCDLLCKNCHMEIHHFLDYNKEDIPL
jgi:hypothetical protein